MSTLYIYIYIYIYVCVDARPTSPLGFSLPFALNSYNFMEFHICPLGFSILPAMNFQGLVFWGLHLFLSISPLISGPETGKRKQVNTKS